MIREDDWMMDDWTDPMDRMVSDWMKEDRPG